MAVQRDRVRVYYAVVIVVLPWFAGADEGICTCGDITKVCMVAQAITQYGSTVYIGMVLVL